jgi:hypothetical protein
MLTFSLKNFAPKISILGQICLKTVFKKTLRFKKTLQVLCIKNLKFNKINLPLNLPVKKPVRTLELLTVNYRTINKGSDRKRSGVGKF